MTEAQFVARTTRLNLARRALDAAIAGIEQSGISWLEMNAVLADKLMGRLMSELVGVKPAPAEGRHDDRTKTIPLPVCRRGFGPRAGRHLGHV